MTTPILLLGAGRMGGALVKGWLEAGAFEADNLIVRDPNPSGDALKAGRVNPADESLASASTVVLAVKPQLWREAAAAIAPLLGPDAIVVSIAAGVKLAEIEDTFGRRVARVMPTTGVAIGQGVASIFAHDDKARAAAHALFDPVAATADLQSEELMDAATAVSGSAPAYLYAFIEALAAAGVEAGLSAETAATLARQTIVSAAALLGAGDDDPAELRRQVTSPGGTTEAALKVLMPGFAQLVPQAVAAAVKRSKELG